LPDQIFVNVRALHPPLTGVQRYTREIVMRLGQFVVPVRPRAGGQGVRGHLWEQTALKYHVGDGILWSPANTGPLNVRRQVLTIHDMVAFDHPEWLSGRFSRWYRILLPRLVGRVQRILTVSEFTKTRIVDWLQVAPESIEIVPNGVDERFTCRSDASDTGVRQREGLPNGRYILFVGSLEPRKNLPTLLRAWDLALNRLPSDVWLCIAGARADRAVFGPVEIGRIPNRVRFIGHVPDEDLPALYAGAAVFVYPSVYEGFGLPPLEAMSCGTPTIVSRTPALREVVGDAARTVEPDDVEGFASAICEVAEDPVIRQQLSDRGLRRARCYTWDRAAEGVERVLRAAATSAVSERVEVRTQ
jgi:glycosyltransferase involved in cell wall biosynthesis